MQVASKKVYWKNSRVFQTLAPYCHLKKYFIRTFWLKFLSPHPAKTFLKLTSPSTILEGGGGACLKNSIKSKSVNTKPFPAGLSPRIICQASRFLLKMSQNCCTHQVWTVPPFPEPLWLTLGMGKNPNQQPKIYSFRPSEKSPLIDLNLSLSKVSFLPNQTAIFK